MIGGARKIDMQRLRHMKSQGLSSSQIAQRMGVTIGAIHHAVRRLESPPCEVLGGKNNFKKSVDV